MSLFGFNVSKQDASSQSSSLGLGYGYSGSGSAADSVASSRGVSGGSSSQQVAFSDLFQSLFANAGGATAKAAGAASGVTGAANTLFNSGGRFLESIGGGGAGDAYLEQRLSADNPVLNEQIGALGSDIGRFLKEQVNPAIAERGVATGTLGGGRQGVAQGLAARSATEEFQRGATSLRAQDVAARDTVASQLMGNRTAAAGVGLGALPGLFGLAQGGSMAELSPYLALAQIMGGPTVLGESSQFSSDVSDSVSRSLSQSFGEDFSYDSAQSTSKQKGRSFGMEAGSII